MKYLLFFLAFVWLLPCAHAQNCAIYINVSPVNGTGPWNLKAIAVQDTTAPPPHPQIVSYVWSTGATTAVIQASTVGQYCVTATFDNGCTTSKCVQVTSNPNSGCWLNLSSQAIPGTTDHLVSAYAGPSSAGPFTYLWNNGQTTDQITVTTPGNYCATITSAQTGCKADTCIGLWWKTCGLSIAKDAQNNVNATATGAAPFAYLWSNGATTASLNNPTNGNYCLTMTDATGCSDVACIIINNTTPSCTVTTWHDVETGEVFAGLASSPANLGPSSYVWSDPNLPNEGKIMPGFDWTSLCVTITNSDGCSSTKCITNEYKDKCIWNINRERINSTTHKLTPFGRFGDNATYVWSTGETTKSITIEDAGTYTVTVNGTCTDVMSTSFDWTNDLMVIMNNAPLEKNTDIKTWLIEYSPAQGGTLTAIQEKFLDFNITNVCFFENLPDGEYLIKAAYMPGSSAYQTRLPTYYKSKLWWHEGTPVTIPTLVHSNFGGTRPITITFIEGQNPGGPGFVGGLVSEGANFTHNGTENAAPIYPATVILYDQDGKIVAGVSTAPDGTFEVKNLPFGTYKLMIDAPGLPQHAEWITIGPNQPQLKLDIKVNKSSATVQVKSELAFSVWPNPVFDGQIHIDAPAEGVLTVKNIQGQIVYSQNISTGASHFSLPETTPGIYFIEIQTAEGRCTKKIVVGKKP